LTKNKQEYTKYSKMQCV